jgi:hypothetical protein
MTDLIHEQAKDRLEVLLQQVQGKLPAHDYKAALSFMNSGEYTLTFEHLCESLYEHQVTITPAMYEQLEATGRLLGYTDPSHWTELAPQIRA